MDLNEKIAARRREREGRSIHSPQAPKEKASSQSSSNIEKPANTPSSARSKIETSKKSIKKPKPLIIRIFFRAAWAYIFYLFIFDPDFSWWEFLIYAFILSLFL